MGQRSCHPSPQRLYTRTTPSESKRPSMILVTGGTNTSFSNPEWIGELVMAKRHPISAALSDQGQVSLFYGQTLVTSDLRELATIKVNGSFQATIAIGDEVILVRAGNTRVNPNEKAVPFMTVGRIDGGLKIEENPTLFWGDGTRGDFFTSARPFSATTMLTADVPSGGMPLRSYGLRWTGNECEPAIISVVPNEKPEVITFPQVQSAYIGGPPALSYTKVKTNAGDEIVFRLAKYDLKGCQIEISRPGAYLKLTPLHNYAYGKILVKFPVGKEREFAQHVVQGHADIYLGHPDLPPNQILHHTSSRPVSGRRPRK